MRRAAPVLILSFISAALAAITNDPELAGIAEATRLVANSPAAGVAVVLDGEIRVGVAGAREVRGPADVAPDDLWHVGSNTKSMTATLVARLAENGTISWEDTIGGVLGDSVGDVHPDYARLTYSHLLTHRAGLPGNISFGELVRFITIDSERTPIREQRLEYSRRVLRRRPAGTPGEFEYSNGGYVVAAAMLEASTGMSWEQLMQAEVFDPLGLQSAGFGPPGFKADRRESRVVDQPRGHRNWLIRGLRPVRPGPNADNPAFTGPAGTVHMSLEDLARYLSAHLAGSRGEESEYLSPESWALLHTPPAGFTYAMGWGVKGAVISHNGSNTLWYVSMEFRPGENAAAIVAFNDGRIRRLAGQANETIRELATLAVSSGATE